MGCSSNGALGELLAPRATVLSPRKMEDAAASWPELGSFVSSRASLADLPGSEENELGSSACQVPGIQIPAL